MAEWRMDAVGAQAIGQAFVSGGVGFLAKARGVTRTFGQLVATQAQANASGRPGPRAVTGDLRRSIHAEMGGNAYASWVDVGSNKPQARRLELGFRGVDSLGRRYNQGPLPYLGPALDRFDAPYEVAIAALVDEI